MTSQAWFAVLCLVAPHCVSAEIYRWVDADGKTHFSDRRPVDAAVQLIIPESTPKIAPVSEVAEPGPEDPRLGPYRVFNILSPAAGTVLVQPTDDLSINLLLDPPLLEDHRLELLLDGESIALEPDTSQLLVSGIGYGAHRLQSVVRDGLQAVVAATPVHDLELRQALPPGVLP
jgi:hypothetical protein